MKFAKELEQDLVPEWRIKYLNYKAGKKYIKGVSRAIKQANATPRRKSDTLPPRRSQSYFRSPLSRRQDVREAGTGAVEEERAPGPAREDTAAPGSTSIPPERQSLTNTPVGQNHYGSFGSTQPDRGYPITPQISRNDFTLPAPALSVPSISSEQRPGPVEALRRSGGRAEMRRSISLDQPGPGRPSPATLPRSSPLAQQITPGRLRRLFSHGSENAKSGYDMQALDTVRQREREFFDFLDRELDKVETFYRQKEEQSDQRLAILREQLREMRDRRTQEMAEIRQRKKHEHQAAEGVNGTSTDHETANKWIDPIKSKIFRPGANSRALSKLPVTPLFGARGGDAKKDYSRRPHEHDVPYRTAKRKLKLALQEFYRGLELLKSYALLNRTAFRKLNKKYDKAVNARPPLRYMNEKVNKAWFVNSDVVDGHIRAVEDLYARYFEKGNRKIAAGKLRQLNRRPADESSISFQNGLFIGIGAVFTVQGFIYGLKLLSDPDPAVRVQTSYLLQIYAGYFLMLYLFALFCLNCYFWTANKINYPFIFEFDTRHNLDWRQLATFPSFFLLLFGVFLWLNFRRIASELWLYYPVILIGVSLAIILLPAPVLWHRTRQWLVYSHFRLLFAGFYPVEFRDFFLGDLYCSLTYATCNIELFFCLYAHQWNQPPQCNSSHSRLLGFFYALPAIWRALQCIRRYRDTKNVFPHLVNCGKYGMTIMQAVTLSLYRIEGTITHLVLFIIFSALTGVYTSIWDLFMDFSLLQPDAREPFLRDILGLKRRWPYYAIMIVDPLLRFTWIFYAIFTYDREHSTFVSFLVAFGEVTRRGMWTLFRVENEHCSNVAQYKASRDLPLPYRLEHEPLMEHPGGPGEDDEESAETAVATASSVGVDAAGASARLREGNSSSAARAAAARTSASAAERGEGGPGSHPHVHTARPQAELYRTRSIRGLIALAHTQDFEKKRRPPPAERSTGVGGVGGDASADEAKSDDDEDDDDDDLEEEEDDEDETSSMVEDRMEVRHAESLVRGDRSVHGDG